MLKQKKNLYSSLIQSIFTYLFYWFCRGLLTSICFYWCDVSGTGMLTMLSYFSLYYCSDHCLYSHGVYVHCRAYLVSVIIMSVSFFLDVFLFSSFSVLLMWTKVVWGHLTPATYPNMAIRYICVYSCGHLRQLYLKNGIPH